MKAPRAKRTEFERIIEEAAAEPRGLVSNVVTKFDVNAGLLYLSRSFSFGAHYEVPSEMPSSMWVTNTLSNFVRGEFGSVAHIEPPPPPKQPVFADSVRIDPDVAMFQYLASCERKLVFSGYANAVARNSGKDVLARLYSLLTHPVLGNGANAKNISFDEFERTFKSKVSTNERLYFIFPGFPFKDQNPFRTLGAPTDYDLAEAALLIRLHTLSVAIYQTYHIGAEWVILTDGTAFSEALRVSREDTIRYQEGLRRLRNHLDLGRAISLVSFGDLSRFFDHPTGYWASLLEHIEGELRTSSLNSPFLEFLTKGMKRNVNLADLRNELGWDDWWSILHYARDQMKSSLKEVWEEVNRVCYTSAVKYAAFNLATKWLNMERSFFPTAIRATIHPKKGQIAVPRLGSEFPWNSLAFVSGEEIDVETVSCRSLHDLSSQGQSLVRYVDEAGRVFFISH